MRVTTSFLGGRLKEAMQYRGMGITDLARAVDGISKQSISLYVRGDNKPSYENIEKMARILDMPVGFFTNADDRVLETDNIYFRSQSTASKKQRISQSIKVDYVGKIYKCLSKYVDFPKLNLPNSIEIIDDGDIFTYITDEGYEQLEKLATELRELWKLGNSPIVNMQYLLESNGIIVTGFKDVDARIDAFSKRIRFVDDMDSVQPLYIIAVALGSKSQQRLKFDMAHELGHLLLHSFELETELMSKEEFNAMEKQANTFASVFLLPKDSFGKDVALYPTKLQYYLQLKKKWGVSIQAMLYRARQLDIISSYQYQYMMRQISKNGWRKSEPADIVGELYENIFQGAIDAIVNSEYMDSNELCQEFAHCGVLLNIRDLENILSLREGTFKETDISQQRVKLRLIK